METNNQKRTTHDHQNEVLIRAEGVGKKFCRSLKQSLFYGIQDVGNELIGKSRCDAKLRKEEFWANQNISFELKRGECLGLIGKNGAGKTTLLKILNGLIKPDKGRIEMRGRIGALIALGAGFNPVLTGRENVFIAGSVLGFTKKEIYNIYDEIIDFAGIEKYMETPVQSYSSGMQVRLGFAVASSMKPDILLVDEVLAVGDMAFRVKCYNRIKEILKNTGVVLVSHNMNDIAKVANQVLVLSSGERKYLGGTTGGIEQYYSDNESEIGGAKNEYIIHMKDCILDVRNPILKVKNNDYKAEIDLSFEVESKCDIEKCRLRVVFFDSSDIPVAEWDSAIYGKDYDLKMGSNKLEEYIEDVRLKSATYRVAVVLTDKGNVGYYFSVDYGLKVTISNENIFGAPYKI